MASVFSIAQKWQERDECQLAIKQEEGSNLHIDKFSTPKQPRNGVRWPKTMAEDGGSFVRRRAIEAPEDLWSTAPFSRFARICRSVVVGEEEKSEPPMTRMSKRNTVCETNESGPRVFCSSPRTPEEAIALRDAQRTSSGHGEEWVALTEQQVRGSVLCYIDST
jgi:hypothetical protein